MHPYVRTYPHVFVCVCLYTDRFCCHLGTFPCACRRIERAFFVSLSLSSWRRVQRLREPRNEQTRRIRRKSAQVVGVQLSAAVDKSRRARLPSAKDQSPDFSGQPSCFCLCLRSDWTRRAERSVFMSVFTRTLRCCANKDSLMKTLCQLDLRCLRYFVCGIAFSKRTTTTIITNQYRNIYRHHHLRHHDSRTFDHRDHN